MSNPFHLPGEICGKEGKVVHCAECRRMALEFGGLRVVFHRRGSGILIAHMRNFLSMPRSDSEPETVALGMGEEEDLLLLNRAQAKEAAELIGGRRPHGRGVAGRTGPLTIETHQ